MKTTFLIRLLTLILGYCHFEFVTCLQEVYQFTSLDNCTSVQYFDTDSLKCSSCDIGYVQSHDGTSCVCPSTNHRTGKFTNSTKYFCRPCKNVEYISDDGRYCVPRNCTKRLGGGMSCITCNKSQITVTNYRNGTVLPMAQCLSCAPGYTPSSDGRTCEPCKIFINDVSTCECSSKYFTLFNNEECVPNSFIKSLPGDYQLATASGEKFNSYYYEKYWITSNYRCKYGNMTACQTAANICVLTLYDESQEGPCKLWKNGKSLDVKPMIMYGEDESYSILYRKKINIVFNLNEYSELNSLDFVGVGYDIFGKVNQYLDDKPNWLLLCPSVWKNLEGSMMTFGTNFRYKCSIGVQQLMSQRQTMFYELYLKFKDGDVENQLYTIPVLIRTRWDDSNKENDVYSWQLVKRFYLVDILSGKSNTDRDDLKYLRYAKSLHFEIKIRKKGKGERSKIYPPLLMIQYDEVDAGAIKDNEFRDIEFSIRYELEGGGLASNMEIAVGSISAFAVLYSILQSWSHSKRSGKIGIDPYMLIQFLVFASGNLSNTFYVVAFGASVHSFLIFKTQKVIYVTVPSERDEYMITTFVIVAFSLKIIEMLAMNWSQIRIEISFIDWEKPTLTNDEVGFKPANLKPEPQVAFWRPYFVAKEWNNIQTLRKISLPLHLVCCVFVLDVLNLSSLASVGVDVAPENPSGCLSPFVYQFALVSLVFLMFYILQLLLSLFIYERYVKNTILDFMDMCSIANVSMLIFDETLHGYYLHGRCVHTSSESDIRGLQPGLPNRAFSVRFTTEFRMYFNRLCVHPSFRNQPWQWQHHVLLGREHGNVNASVSTGIGSMHRPNSQSSKKGVETVSGVVAPTLPHELEQRVQISNLANKFLTAFFDHALEDLDYEVRETKYIERLLDVEIMNESNHKIVLLYNSTGNSQSFQQTIWYGQEWTLITFDLYLFCLIQITSGSHILAALITVIVWKFLSICRKYGGKKNLAGKILIDERFLS